MVIQILTRPRCGSTDVILHGKDTHGVQRYRCHACDYTFREEPKANGYTEDEKQRILLLHRLPGSVPERVPEEQHEAVGKEERGDQPRGAVESHALFLQAYNLSCCPAG